MNRVVAINEFRPQLELSVYGGFAPTAVRWRGSQEEQPSFICAAWKQQEH
jgi:hypothetical protein